MLFIGGIMLLIDILKITTNREPNYGNFQPGFAYMGIVTSISLMVSGVVFLAFGEMIQVAVDIAVNTAEMVEHGRETSAFFGRVAAKANPSDEPRAIR
jgi:hypothetical protein